MTGDFYTGNIVNNIDNLQSQQDADEFMKMINKNSLNQQYSKLNQQRNNAWKLKDYYNNNYPRKPELTIEELKSQIIHSNNHLNSLKAEFDSYKYNTLNYDQFEASKVGPNVDAIADNINSLNTVAQHIVKNPWYTLAFKAESETPLIVLSWNKDIDIVLTLNIFKVPPYNHDFAEWRINDLTIKKTFVEFYSLNQPTKVGVDLDLVAELVEDYVRYKLADRVLNNTRFSSAQENCQLPG